MTSGQTSTGRVSSYHASVEAAPSPQSAAEQHWAAVAQRRAELTAQGRFEEAAELLGEYVSQTRDSQPALAALGFESLRLFRWDAAIDAFLRALVLKPDDGAVQTGLGTAFVKTGCYVSAARSFERALRLEHSDPTLLKRYWAAVSKAKSFAEAVAVLRELFDNGKEPQVAPFLAQALERIGDVAAACAVLEEARDRAPDDARVLAALGRMYLRDGQHHAAVDALEPVAAKSRPTLELQLTLADAYAAAERPADALAIVRTALSERPNTAVLWERCAAAHAAMGAAAEADACTASARAAEERVRRAQELIGRAPAFESRWSLLNHAVEVKPPEGLILEFGVAGGASIRYVAQRVDAQVFGFDSFEGLPEESDAWTKGQFAQRQLPAVPSNAELIVGWFDQTLDDFLREHAGAVSLLHIDCDLYVSSRYVLDRLLDRLVPGTVIVFDELWRYAGWENHEWRALEEVLIARGVEIDFIGHVRSGPQAAIRVTALDDAVIDGTWQRAGASAS